ncbi:MAG: PQQ-like beta-propeller repeat protein [Candidatus Lokiarchaeota archaeon]|nr:PQQ-like beta-propeller repeat protein [Candidatus Lokiarchaeota archaeon]
MKPVVLTTIDGPAGEVDAFDCFSLPSDEAGMFHVIHAANTMKLSRIDARVHEGVFSTREAWQREAGSRSWHVVVDPGVPAPGPAVFTAREDGHFHAYSLDGDPCWSHDFAATVSEFKLHVDPFTGERMLVIPSLDKTLRLLHAENGRLAWGDTFQSGVNVADQCLLDDGETHVIVAGGNDYTLRCYIRKKGTKPGAYKMAWFHKFESYVRDASISPAGQVAAVADDGFLKVLDVRTGAVSWRHEHDSFAWKCKVLPSIGKVVSTSYQLPLAVDETGQKMGNPGVVACHDLLNGQLAWSTRPEDGVNVNAWTMHDDAGKPCIIAGTTAGDVLLMDAGTGHVVQRHPMGHAINHVAACRIPGGLVGIVGCREQESGSLFAGVDEG